MFPGKRNWLLGATLDDVAHRAAHHDQKPPPKPAEMFGTIGFALAGILYMTLVIVSLVALLVR
jgi:hypothetical protein